MRVSFHCICHNIHVIKIPWRLRNKTKVIEIFCPCGQISKVKFIYKIDKINK